MEQTNDITDVSKSPFGSDSDYSSVENDGSKFNTLFADASLFDTTDRVENANSDNSFDGFDNIVINEEDVFCVDPTVTFSINSFVTGKQVSSDQVSNKIPDSSDVAIFRRRTTSSEKVRRDSPNQHDYALPNDTDPTQEQMSKTFISGKFLPSAKSEKDMAVSNKVGLTLSSQIQMKDIPKSHMTKNAIAARENRLKKKQYIHTLEKSVQELKSENKGLKDKVTEMSASINEMTSELEYMHRILSNVDEISSLVKGIKTLPNFQPETCRKRCRENDCTQTLVTKFPRNAKSCSLPFKAFSGSTETSPGKPGICIHVRGSTMSLELCHHCSKKAVSKLL